MKGRVFTGLFSGIKLAADMIKGGIASMKAVEKMDQLVERSRTEYAKNISPAEEQLYQAYKKLNAEQEAEQDTEKSSNLMEKTEAAEVQYLMALADDAAFPREFQAEIILALAEYCKTNDAPMEAVEKYMMGMAKDDEEKAAVREILDGAKKEMAEEEAAKKAEAQS